MKKMIPEENLWPHNVGGLIGSGSPTEDPGNYNKWDYHSCRGGSNFNHIDRMQTWNDGAFGGADTIDEWVMQAQLYDYEYQRAIYEALSKHRYSTATGFINWMMNGVRPTIMWNQFDFYMNPHGSTYGVGKANEPLHIMYDPYRKEISVMNYTFEDAGELTAEMTLYDIDGKVISNGTISKPVDVKSDAIGERTGTAIDRVVGFKPSQYVGDKWYDADIAPYTISYGTANADGAKRAKGNGVSIIWNKSEIDSSLARPTSDVYFMRLELKDGDDVVSYNTYAIPRRQDTASGRGNAGLGGIYISQTMDWTQLKQLPAVQLDVTVGDATRDGNYILQTVTLTNNTKSIAHGIELKSYMGTDSAELCPATYSDNLITLFPGQTRKITVKHNTSYLDGPVNIRVNCFNNMITNRPIRKGNVYLSFDPIGQTVEGTTDTTPNATTNLARNRQYAIGAAEFAVGNMTNIRATAVDQANRVSTVLDSDFDNQTQVTVTPAQEYFTIDLGASKTFDRTMVRWNGPNSTNMMGGTPDRVKVEVSDSAEGPWTVVANYDNTQERAILTNIVFDTPVKAQYIRYSPSGLTLGSTSYGAGPGSVSSQTTSQRANPTAFVVGGVEVYNTFNYAFVDIQGNAGTVSANGGPALSAASSVADKAVNVYVGDKAEFIITPVNPSDKVLVTIDGVDATAKLTAVAGGYMLALEDVVSYTEVSVIFEDVVELDIAPDSIVEDLAANILVAGAGIDGASLYLVSGGNKIGSGIMKAGKGILSIVKAPAAVGSVDIFAEIDGIVVGKGSISIIAYNTDIWTAQIGGNAEGNLTINFAAPIALTDKAAFTVGAAVFAQSELTLTTTSVSCASNYEEIAVGTVIRLSGLKYPQLFPSYSFTFSFVK